MAGEIGNNGKHPIWYLNKQISILDNSGSGMEDAFVGGKTKARTVGRLL